MYELVKLQCHRDLLPAPCVIRGGRKQQQSCSQHQASKGTTAVHHLKAPFNPSLTKPLGSRPRGSSDRCIEICRAEVIAQAALTATVHCVCVVGGLVIHVARTMAGKATIANTDSMEIVQFEAGVQRTQLEIVVFAV